MASPVDSLLQDLPPEAQERMAEVMEWFNSTVGRLEGAYREIGVKFDRISRELEEKNQRLETALADTERVQNQLRSVLESLDSAVVMVDGEERVTLFNPAAERIYAIPAVEAQGVRYSEVFSEQAEGHFPLLVTLRSGKGSSGHEKGWTIGGVRKPIGYTTSLVKDREGAVLGAVEVSTDLTAYKKMERQVQHARTLAALGEMAATVAHEIRNPLGGIGGFAGLLMRDLEPGDRRRILVDRIVHGVASLNKIVSNLLVYTRPLELQLRKVDLLVWLEELLKAVEAEAAADGRPLRVERRYGFTRLEALVDPEKLQQVILNLLVNASQAYGEGGGVITVEAEMDESDFLRLSVEDHGPGIPDDIREQIFNPFFTTKQQGTGLGLAIVQRIVDLHGGRIGVKSAEGGPTRFEIRLDPRGSLHG